ncbi:hypothetical protein L1987_00839 [Smallanthus sonchifolius]|uniref:Uncharacterized protein n=1 Tax=Smallanthus sonchifolius TaxID=185202 RepID=A0ACB9K3D1_9ASTR|nr:hypothetical protein L1987_00839 [Smallanthus sonchifolius]
MVILTEDLETSSSTYDHKYDVFLSFRGADTRLSFTNHLHTALVNANLTTFLDNEEIQTGEFLKPELESAIKASRASIIVLSENYAYSKWCLDELAEKMEIWKNALTQVSHLKGKDAKGRLEMELIEEIVSDIYTRVGVPLSTTTLPQLMGMEDHIERITSWLNDGSNHTADILTIWGMGGIGKTSLANYVYELHRCEYTSCSFVGDISRRCAGKYQGLLDVQKQLYGDISKRNLTQVHNVYGYTSMICKALAREKVLLVLDDIDSLDQLNDLLGDEGFQPGSEIIITTKDASLTESCALFNPQVQPKHIKVLINGLGKSKSLELLCIHAFKSQKPKEGYKEVLEKLVKYCDGHPLALQVLGRSLQNHDVSYWENCIKVLKREPHSHINTALKMSFETMPFENDKELFKHIACFFVGIDRDMTEVILNACDINTSRIMILIDRCLLSIGWNNKLMMHQLVQEMGRDLVRQESPNKPWESSRLWCHEESFKVLEQEKTKGVDWIKLERQTVAWITEDSSSEFL